MPGFVDIKLCAQRVEIVVSSTDDMLAIGSIHDLNYWCDPKELFGYLDTVAPHKGSKFPCPVCSSTQWGCSTVDAKNEHGATVTVVAPCQMPLKLPGNKTVEMEGRELPNYHYAIVCLTCANTIFLNAAMVQARLLVTKGLKYGG